MNTWKKILLGLAAFLTTLAGGYGVNETLGAYRTNQPEVTAFTTSTNANYADIPVFNVNDFDSIGFTVDANTASGTLRMACSMQDIQPTGAATSSANRYDFVDFVDTATETSIDGWAGIVLSNTTNIRQFTVRNSVWKWCFPHLSGNTTPAGYGTTTVYVKRVDNL